MPPSLPTRRLAQRTASPLDENVRFLINTLAWIDNARDHCKACLCRFFNLEPSTHDLDHSAQTSCSTVGRQLHASSLLRDLTLTLWLEPVLQMQTKA